jgi:hypothetical protein
VSKTLLDLTPPNPLTQFDRLTMADLHTVYPLLAAPFPEEAIERTFGAETGRGYNTTGIGYQYIIDRFNAILGPGHLRTTVNALTVTSTQTAKGKTLYQAECDLTLAIGNWVAGQWETIAEAQNYGGHDSLSLVDAKKGARSNAFKKAAAFFGPGHEAYLGIIDDDSRPATVPDFPPGEFAVRLDGGAVEQKTSKDGKPYSLFSGKAVLLATGEAFPLKAFGRLGELLTAHTGETLAVTGAWNDRFGSFDVREIHLTPTAPATPTILVAPATPAAPGAPVAPSPPPESGAQIAPVAPMAPNAPPVADTPDDADAPPDPDPAASPSPARPLTQFDDLLPAIEQLKGLGLSSPRIADALKRAIPKQFREYAPDDVRAADALLQKLIAHLVAHPEDATEAS